MSTFHIALNSNKFIKNHIVKDIGEKKMNICKYHKKNCSIFIEYSY